MAQGVPSDMDLIGRLKVRQLWQVQTFVRCRQATTPDSERRPKALGRVLNTRTLFLYITGWIGWVGRSYLIAISDEKKPAMKEIIIDGPVASRLIFCGFIWPVAAYRALLNGDLIAKDV
ncbi:unnamed protein product [Eruca vesicaria subsp. sativa]|uniref:Photosystem I reaction center subunit III n=1 Tax=Eruca vesicaria subsp. sativa TaxID=29727 RepID=A0ABC8LRG0_ERUVS|nr:unnamed protein product [Eruca vesicaria subsp. sativa]